MSLYELPDPLIAQIADYLKHSNICNLMETNSCFYKVIKRYRKDTIKLSSLDFYFSSERTNMNAIKDFAPYFFKNFDKMEENVDKVKQVLDKSSSIDELHLYGKSPFNDELFHVLMNTKAKIRTLHLQREEYFTLEEKIKIGRKFRVVFTFEYANSALWSDEFLTSILPRSTISDRFLQVIGSVDAPMPITDLTLNALISGSKVQGKFSIENVHNSITIIGITKVIKNLHERFVDNYLIWYLGILQPNEAKDAERYFGENGEMRGICDVKIARKTDLIHYNVNMFEDGFKIYKYRIFFDVINY